MNPSPRPSRLGSILAAIAVAALLALGLVWGGLQLRSARTTVASVEIEPDRLDPLAVPPWGVPVGIGAFEARVASRLAAERPVLRPVRTPVRVHIDGVAQDDPLGRPVLRAASATALVDLGALLRRELLVQEMTVRRPVFTFERRTGEVEWNFQRVLAQLAGDDDDPETGLRRAVLRDISIVDGRAEVQSPEVRFTMEAGQATLARLALVEPGLAAPVLELARLATTLVVPAAGVRLPLVAEAGTFRFPTGRLEFALGQLRSGDSRLQDARGDWVYDAPGLGVRGRARGSPVRFAELRELRPEWLPPAGQAHFQLAFDRSPAGDTRLSFTDVVATVPDPASEVRGALDLLAFGPAGFELLTADLRLGPLALALLEPFTGPLPYGGVLEGRITGAAADLVVDLVARLTTPGLTAPFPVGITGTVALLDADLLLRRLVLELERVPLLALEPLVPGLPLRGVVTGQVVLRGLPRQQPLELDVELALAQGTVGVVGTVDLTGPVPGYQLTGQLLGLRLQELFEPALPPVLVAATFSVTGQGTDPAVATARLELTGEFTGWRAEPADGVWIRALLSGGTLSMDNGLLELAGARVALSGAWRVVEPAAGALTYDIDVDELEPWGPYLPWLPEPSRGRLAAAGTLSGSLARPRLAGTARVEGLAAGEWFAQTATASYELGLGLPIAEIVLEAVAQGVVTPGLGDFATATVRFRRAAPSFALEARGERPNEAVALLNAEGVVLADGTHEATLRVLSIDTPDDGRWTLEAPALVRWGGPAEELEIRGLVLRQEEQEGLIAIDGQLPTAPGAGVRIQLSAVPLAPLFRLAGVTPVVTGIATLDAELTGVADAPVLRATFELADGALGGLPYERVEGSASYADQRLGLEGSALLAEAAPVQVSAELPLAIATTIPPSAALLEDRPLRAEAAADSLPLQVLERFTPDITDARGVLRAFVRVAGTATAPVLAGSVQVWDGAATIPLLDRRYEQITALLVLEERVVRIDTLRARSDGWADVSGSLRFERLTRPVLDLVIHLDGFRALGFVERQSAAAVGTLGVTGPFDDIVVRGRLSLDDGDFSIPAILPGEALDDDFIALGQPTAVAGQLLEPAAAPALPGVTIDGVVIAAGESLWLVTEELRAQLAGEITLFAENGDVRIFGSLGGTRGTFTLRVGPLVRRFDIVQSEVQFFGTSPPNPAIAVTASRVVHGAEGRRTEILAHVGGTLLSPTLALSTPDAALIPESELLSFILFGQPTFALGAGVLPGVAVLEEALLGGLAELATIELEDALLRDLGLPLHRFQIRPAPGAVPWLGAPSLVFGVEVADDVFVTVESGLGILFGPTESITNTWSIIAEWRIDPEWSATLGFEPINRARLFRGLGTALPSTAPERQVTVDLRRRWTY